MSDSSAKPRAKGRLPGAAAPASMARGGRARLVGRRHGLGRSVRRIGSRTLPFWLVSASPRSPISGVPAGFSFPIGALIVVLAALARRPSTGFARRCSPMLVVRIGFVFVAIGLPALVGSIVKRLIGRVRPTAEAAFAYQPFSWRPDYASMPSGHAITAFGALVAIGIMFPRARPYLWVYAITIAVSRIVVSAHFPSDVIAGAAFGAFGVNSRARMVRLAPAWVLYRAGEERCSRFPVPITRPGKAGDRGCAGPAVSLRFSGRGARLSAPHAITSEPGGRARP